jgi:histidine triad (HIT) family protein
MADCLFCRITSGELLTTIQYQDDLLVAFSDLRPVAPVHILIVPRQHFTDFNAMADDPAGVAVMTAVMKAVPHIAAAAGIRDSGYRLINNCGADGGQTIKHVHFHLIGGRPLGAVVVDG